MKQYKDMTNFPKIYERSYWGWFAVTEQNPTDIIINNRNKFVTDYNIRAFKDHHMIKAGDWMNDQRKHGLRMDHVEMYFVKEY